MRYLYALMGLLLLLAATATAGSFKAEMDVETYVDANNTNQSFADSDLLWAASQDGRAHKTGLFERHQSVRLAGNLQSGADRLRQH